VRVVRYEQQAGYIVRRNQSGQLARSPFLISIDDDAVFTDPDVVNDVVTRFDEPLVAVVMIPHLNCTTEEEVRWSAPTAPDDGQTYITNTFIGTGYALRRSVFNSLGGFQARLFHWNEESEFSQRLLNAGYVVTMGARHRVRHYPNWAGKYDRKNLRFIYRNRVLTVWFNAPLILLPLLLPVQGIHALKMAILKPHEKLVALEGTVVGLFAMLRYWRVRKPATLAAYRMWFQLRGQHNLRLADITHSLPLSDPNMNQSLSQPLQT
jgi:GT2 family glycosyltransferase